MGRVRTSSAHTRLVVIGGITAGEAILGVSPCHLVNPTTARCSEAQWFWSAFWLSAVVILWRAASSFSGSMRESLVVSGNFEDHPLTFGVAYLRRESATFLGAVEPVRGIVDGCDEH